MHLDDPTERLRPLAVATGLAVLVGAVLVGVLRLLPEGSYSFDVHSWLGVAGLLRQGRNPYNETNLLNWPPLWMQLLYLFDQVSQLIHLRLLRVIQLFLVVVDALVAAVAYLMLRRHWNVRRSWLLITVGIALNPVAIILIDVHGNFDVVVALLVTLFLWAITGWRRHGRPEDWLLACLCVGVGGLTKTVPFVLAPLLLTGWRRLNMRLGVLGSALLLGPVVVGVSVIYVFGPQQVTAHVLDYRSIPGTFGMTGLTRALNLPVSDHTYTRAFEVLMLAVVAMVVVRAVRRGLSERELILLTALLLMLPPILGPGYAPQYAWWWLPTLVMAYALEGFWLRVPLLVLFVVASVTYAVDYALVPTLGGGVLVPGHPSWAAASRVLASSLSAETYLRLPLFAAYLVVLLAAAVQLARRRPAPLVDAVRGAPEAAAR